MRKNVLRAVAVLAALVTLGFASACGAAGSTKFSARPSDAKIAEAQAYAVAHAADKVDYTTNDDYEDEGWVRGVVIQEGLGESRELGNLTDGVKWKAIVVWPDGTQDVVAAVGSGDVDEVDPVVSPGDYIAYFRRLGGMFSQDSCKVIKSGAVKLF